ncbi:MAG: HAD family hydrolase [Alteromonadaceae bacterium]|nr:HAD family hydrolase [Alteromonadaceae bacterium]
MLIKELISQLAGFDEIIFDLDNTLFDQGTFDIGAFEDIESELKSLSGSPLVNFADFLASHKKKMGNNYGYLFNDALAQYHLPNHYISPMLSKYYNHDGRYIKISDSLIPKISKLFAVKNIFIVTNGPTKVQTTKVTKLKLQALSKEIIICDPKKPNTLKPEDYAFKLLNKKHNLRNVVMVGDCFETDGLFAKNSNIPFIQFTYLKNNNENI